MRKTHDASTGPLPEGCRLCLRGSKLVVFVTGVCGRDCFYCSLSKKRKGVDAPYANERRIRKMSDLFLEADRMGAEGAGITGGDPLIRMDRTVKYIRALKKKFGQGFHIHLYTTGELATPEKLKALQEAGVDEIRFHWNRKEIIDALGLNRQDPGKKRAVRAAGQTSRERRRRWTVGAEIPAIPGRWDETLDYLRFLRRNGAEFCNLNELDWSEGNVAAFRRRGWKTKGRASYAVAGSEEMALRLVEYSRKHLPGLSVHYCSSRTKDAVQLRGRYLRTAKRVRRDFETVSGDGLLVKAVAEGIRRIPELPAGRQSYDSAKKRMEFSAEDGRRLAKLRKYEGRIWIVRTQPTADGFDMEKTPV